jgi:hypothetical protein
MGVLHDVFLLSLLNGPKQLRSRLISYALISTLSESISQHYDEHYLLSVSHVQGKRADARLNILALHPYKYAAPGSCSQIDQAGIGFT